MSEHAGTRVSGVDITPEKGGVAKMTYRFLLAAVSCVAGLVCAGGCELNEDGDSAHPTTQATHTTSLKTGWPLSREDAVALQEREAERSGVPRFSRLDLGDSVFVDLVFIPPGTFPMGIAEQRDNPPRLVTISKGFLMSKYEITWRQFLRVVDPAEVDLATREVIEDVKEKQQWDYPAGVMWLLAKKFCDRLSAARGIRARLPSEAEWEYACRAGTTGLYGEWDSIDDSKANVSTWVGSDGKEVHSKKRFPWFVPVGQYQPNRWGLHDMMGNAREFCLDAYSERVNIGTLPNVDPVLHNKGALFRVIRGGSYLYAQTVYYRDGDATSGSHDGIRLVIEIDDAIRAKIVEVK